MTDALFTKHYSSFDYYEAHGLSTELRSFLEEDLSIHEEDLDDVFSPMQLSKFEFREAYMYFALQFADKDTQENIITQQVHCFVSQKYLFVIDEDGFLGLRSFDDIRNKLVTKEHYNSFDLFYELLDISVVRMFSILQTIQSRVKSLENAIFSEDHLESDQISRIQNVKKSIINFKSLLAPLEDMLEEISFRYNKLLDEIGKEALDDSLDKIKKLVNRLDNFRETMKLLTETNEMLLARSTNQNVRRLTLFNMLILGPSLVAAFFGMNVHFGWFTVLTDSDSALPVTVIVVFMFFLTGGMFVFFRKKRWI